MVWRSVLAVLAGLLGLSVGCGDATSGPNDEAADEVDASSGSGEEESGSGSESSESESNDSTSDTDDMPTTDCCDGPIFDFPIPDAPVQGGCEAVDFLFVIDDSSSMQDHQQNLIANVPA